MDCMRVDESKIVHLSVGNCLNSHIAIKGFFMPGKSRELGNLVPENDIIWREIVVFQIKKYIRNIGKVCITGGKFSLEILILFLGKFALFPAVCNRHVMCNC